MTTSMSVYLLPLEELLELELLEDPDDEDLEPLPPEDLEPLPPEDLQPFKRRVPAFDDPLLPDLLDPLLPDELPEDDLLEELRVLRTEKLNLMRDRHTRVMNDNYFD